MLNLHRTRQVIGIAPGEALCVVNDGAVGGEALRALAKGHTMTMGFSVDLDAMHRARIRLSSKLPSLARIVKDDPYVR